MPIKVTCPNGHTLKVKDKYAGQTGLCPKCQARVLVPALNEDAICDLIGPPPPEDEWSEGLPVHQDPKHRGLGESSGIGSGSTLRESSIIASKTKVCPKCRNHINARFDLCPNCGLYFANWDEIHRRMHPICQACGAENAPGDTNCRECGAALSVS